MKKRYLVIGIILLLVCMSITPSFAIDNVKKSFMLVSDGNILYVGGMGPGNYTSIQDAIDNASGGDTVFVYDDSSPYYENVVVNKSINLIGEDRNTTIIDKEDNNYAVSIWANVNNALITGFTITGNYPRPLYSYYGISIGGDYNTIKGNKIVFNDYGIYLGTDANNNVITDNIIVHNSLYGLYDECRESNNFVKCNVIGGNGRDTISHKGTGIFKHLSGGNYYKNDFDLNWGGNAHTDGSCWGNWDNGLEGNYWDDWESNPGYPDVYIINGFIEDQIDHYPNATPYFNHPIVLLRYYYADPGEPILFYPDINVNSSSVSWYWDFGDGTTSNERYLEHAYNVSGIYFINVTVTNYQGVSDTDMGIAYIGIRPDAPKITGQTTCRPFKPYNYSIVATDPDSEYLHYYINWRDGDEDYIGPYHSGEVVEVWHSWEHKYNYTVYVEAIDETFYKNWVYLSVSVSRNKANSNNFFMRFLELFPNAFPLLRYFVRGR
jgi:parallel beta-helix repeat protein